MAGFLLSGHRQKRKANLFGLYIHIPFCKEKCRYCDFSSFSGMEKLIPDYIKALTLELESWQVFHLKVKSLYFGGGTPSFLSTEHLESIIIACQAYFNVEEGAERTLEANPGTLSEEYLVRLRNLGINRLSLGVQSFNDNFLRILGRIHRAVEAREAYLQARKAGFENINLDIIFGIPFQKLSHWQKELEAALSLRPEHISLYSLSLEEGTPLCQDVRLNKMPSPDSDLAAEMYACAEEMLIKSGYEHYEISNWCLPGRESQHNLNYWRMGPYIGVGSGSHSFFNNDRFWNVGRPEEYIRGMIEDGKAISGREHISPELERSEYIILGLRLVQGLDLAEYEQRYGESLKALYDEEIAFLKAAGLLEETKGRLRLTPRGRLLGNEVFQRFLPKNVLKI